MVQAVVESHGTHNQFHPDWSVAKDRKSEPELPGAFWKQYTSKLLNTENGFKRSQLVQLWVITSLPTDRTPVQLQEAVEAADVAASDFILAIERDYGNQFERMDNVSITTMHDEYTNLLTGVVLTFTILTAPLCYDPSHFPEPEEP